MLKLISVAATLLLSVSLWADCDKKDCGENCDHKGKGGHFKQMDTTGDGQISEAEWTAHKAKKFAEINTNGDKFISKEEMKAHRQAKKAQRKHKKAHKKGKKHKH